MVGPGSPLMQAALRGSAKWSPLDLGLSLIEWFDAEDVSTLSLSGSLVTNWRGKKTGLDMAQTGVNSRPVYNVTGMNGRPSLFFDGSDDNLQNPGSPFPLTSQPVEIWALTDQQAASSDTGTRRVFAYGEAGNNTSRALCKAPVGANVNGVSSIIGNGSAATGAQTLPAFPNQGIHIGRAIATGTQCFTEIDGNPGNAAAVVPATVAGVTRIGLGTNSAGPWFGQINSIVVVSLLSSFEASQLLAFLKNRGGL